MPTGGEAILGTKPGCVMGIRDREHDRVYVGQFLGSSEEDYSGNIRGGVKGVKVNLAAHVVYDFGKGEIASKSAEPIEISTNYDSMLLGTDLIHKVGGEDQLSEILDALDYRLSQEKFIGYLQTVLQADAEQAREKKAREKARKREARQGARREGIDWGNVKDKAADIGGLAVGGAGLLSYVFYFGGYWPWKTEPDIADKVLEIEYERTPAFVRGAMALATTGLNFLVASIAAKSGDLRTAAAFGTLGLVPAIGGTVHQASQIPQYLREKRAERKEQEEKIVRMERIRQAVCPADSETFYTPKEVPKSLAKKVTRGKMPRTLL